MRLSALILTVTLTAACTTNYWVRTEHLAKARELRDKGVEDVALPARNRRDETRYVKLSYVREVRGVAAETSLERIAVTDNTPLRIPGWITLGLGVAALLTGFAVLRDEESDEVPALAIANFAVGGALIGLGVGLVVPGYVMDPETDAPSPGLPKAVSLRGATLTLGF